MDDIRTTIFTNSKKASNKLQLLSVFFEHELIFKIYIRTQVIHKLFENNPELDINKLELFHLQFTETIIALLRKIKKNNEKNVSLAEAEIELNAQTISSISNSMRLEHDYGQAQQAQTAAVNKALFRLYQNLSDLSALAPFTKAINQFSIQFSKDFFLEVNEEFANQLTDYHPEKTYRNGYGIIEKKLLGLQCRYEFKNSFYCGLKSGDIFLEIYKLTEQKEYFLFCAARSLFLTVDFKEIESIDLSGGISKKAKIVHELTAKNNTLQNNMAATKTNIPAEVNELLNEYHNKIAGMDFMDFIEDFDVQANILKTMLNTDPF